MNKEQIQQLNDNINLLIGSYEDNNKYANTLELSERIKAKTKYRNLREKLMKISKKNEIKASQLNLINEGSLIRGVTPNGKKITWIGNNGITERSRYCGTLTIDGVTIFTSGTVVKIFEYILDN